MKHFFKNPIIPLYIMNIIRIKVHISKEILFLYITSSSGNQFKKKKKKNLDFTH